MDFPCSYGEADKARNVTRNGIHVVSEKYADFYMSNPAAGYSHIHERWAVRISNNGEFIHANPASSGAQGNTNVTNGCINLSTGDAEQYFGSRDLRRPGRGDRQLDRAVLLRRRHLGLGGRLGHLGGDVGAAAAERAPAADVDPAHRAGHAARRADAVGHPDNDDDIESDPAPATPAVEPAWPAPGRAAGSRSDPGRRATAATPRTRSPRRRRPPPAA